MTEGSDEYITVEDAADILQVGIRMVNRYGNGPNARLRTRRAGRRILYNKADVRQLAADLGVLDQARPQRPKTELVPVGDVLDHMAQMQQQLNQAMLEVGRLQGMLEQQKLLTADADELRQRLAAAEGARNALQEELERRSRPWWKRLFG